MTRLARALAARLEAVEVLFGLALVVAGVAVWSAASALIVAGGAILLGARIGWRRP